MPGPVTPGPVRRRDRDGPRPRPDSPTAAARRSTSSSPTGTRRRVFADAPLPFDPAAWSSWTSHRTYPTDDRQQILAFVADGRRSRASTSASTRSPGALPGVLAGAAMAAFLYLLARILFRRREVGGPRRDLRARRRDALRPVADRDERRLRRRSCIVAAYTLFAALWTGYWRWRGAFWVVMPLIGVCLGLALASKWVALYAIGGIGLLILVRSALGRLLAILGARSRMTGVLGYLAIDRPGGRAGSATCRSSRSWSR